MIGHFKSMAEITDYIETATESFELLDNYPRLMKNAERLHENGVISEEQLQTIENTVKTRQIFLNDRDMLTGMEDFSREYNKKLIEAKIEHSNDIPELDKVWGNLLINESIPAHQADKYRKAIEAKEIGLEDKNYVSKVNALLRKTEMTTSSAKAEKLFPKMRWQVKKWVDSGKITLKRMDEFNAASRNKQNELFRKNTEKITNEAQKYLNAAGGLKTPSRDNADRDTLNR